MKYILIVFFIFGKLTAQNIEYIGVKTSKTFEFYRVFKKKCPGFVTNNNCLRFVDVTTNTEPHEINFYECDLELKYRAKPTDTLILNYNIDKFIFKLKESDISSYKLLETIKTYDFNKWKSKKIINRAKFKLYKYYSDTEIKYLVFKTKISVINKMLFEGNIIIDENALNENIYLLIPIE